VNNILFARNLVKGKIAETIFAQMLRDTGEFTVLEFGYEKVIPELIQQSHESNDDVIETLRAAPDFAVINKTTKRVHLIEVKYLRKYNENYMLEHAKRMAKSWNPSYLFLATLDGFYFDEIKDVIAANGQMRPLHHRQINEDLQKKYLQILKDFESP
jgi:hypothetical protein